MKRHISLCIILLIFMLNVTACSFFTNTANEPLNGLLLLGDDRQIQVATLQAKQKKEVLSTNTYTVKSVDLSNKQTLIINEQTAKEFVKKGILRKRDNNTDKISSDPLETLPNVSQNKAVLFAKEKPKNLTAIQILNDTTINLNQNLSYDSDTWIGHMRDRFEEMIIIVSNDTFDKIGIPSKKIGIVEFKQSYGQNTPKTSEEEKKKYKEFQEVTKDLQNVEYAENISIINNK